jgi:nuclear transport factor 2 (NTF2) superfamily protein
MMKAIFDRIADAYAAFNQRDIDRALSAMHADVEWENGMEGGFVHGHEAVRSYWTRQWRVLDPTVEPIAFDEDQGRIVVTVHQVVRDRAGTLLADQHVQHIYSLRDGLVCRMEIASFQARVDRRDPQSN